MKKQILAWLAVAAFPMASWAFQADVIAPAKEGKIPSVAGQLSFGWLNGQAKEHVFDYETADGSRRQLSRLDWDLKNVLMGGVNFSVRPMNMVKGIDLNEDLTFNTANGVTLNFGYWNVLWEGNGEMEDYDWLDYGSSDWTDYSLSDVDVTEGYVFDVNVAWDFIQWKDLATARVFAGYKQNGWSWEDHGKYLLYSEYGYVPQDLYGENMINYEQEFRMPYVGAGVDFTPGNFTVSARLTYSPSVEATDWDDHVARDMHFKETFEGGDMLGFGLDVRYMFSKGPKGLFLSAAVDVQTIDLIVGDMEYYGAGTYGMTVSDDDVAGIENEYTVISLGGGYRF